jgi:DNA-binding PadR family transcriptional regulator
MARSGELKQLDQWVMLAIVRQQPSAYGVSIQDEIAKRAGREFSVGTIYAALSRLEDEGYLASKAGEATAERGGRAKTYFSITATGSKTLSESLRAVDQLRNGTRFAEAG